MREGDRDLESVPPAYGVRFARHLARVRIDPTFAVIVAFGYTTALIVRLMDIQGIAHGWWHVVSVGVPLVVGIHLLASLLFGGYGQVRGSTSVEEATLLDSVSAGRTVITLNHPAHSWGWWSKAVGPLVRDASVVVGSTSPIVAGFDVTGLAKAQIQISDEVAGIGTRTGRGLRLEIANPRRHADRTYP